MFFLEGKFTTSRLSFEYTWLLIGYKYMLVFLTLKYESNEKF